MFHVENKLNFIAETKLTDAWLINVARKDVRS
jgi:hypothetical protein